MKIASLLWRKNPIKLFVSESCFCHSIITQPFCRLFTVGPQKLNDNVDESQAAPSLIDYSVLPSELSRSHERSKEEEKTDDWKATPECQESSVIITKKNIAQFHNYFATNHATYREWLLDMGLSDVQIEHATANFKKNISKEIKEDENLAYHLKKMKDKTDCKEIVFECFLNYIKQRYAFKESLDEIKSLCDLRKVASWYVTARKFKRKIIFHAGPTNNGKTYHALQRFENSNSGIYGGPLRMLAAEVYQRTNKNGILCDMITGEQRLYAQSESEPSDHVSCTVEMYKLGTEYDCAIIDEIQLLRDRERGWGWTNAFLGIQAKEVHVCGEPAAEKLLMSLVKSTGDELEVRRYKRLTPLHIQKKSLGTLKAVRPGDCIVAFSRQKIFDIKREIERNAGLKCSVIYGGLPPSIRLEQARRFNNPEFEQQVLVASDAIGMGLNLSIRRLIFKSLRKFDGKKMISLPPYHAKQIAGRAGRFGTDYPEGFVTTVHAKDLLPLREMLTSPTDDVQKAGLRPGLEQVELLSHVLPKATLTELLGAFELCAKLDGNYFLCDIEHTKGMAEAIEHLPLTLQQQYHLASAATDRTNKSPFITKAVIKIATLFSKGIAIGPNKMKQMLGWPLRRPQSSDDLFDLESVHDVFDLYLWMSYKYEAIFIEREAVRDLQVDIEFLIKQGLDGMSRNRKKKFWEFKRNPFR